MARWIIACIAAVALASGQAKAWSPLDSMTICQHLALQAELYRHQLNHSGGSSDILKNKIERVPGAQLSNIWSVKTLFSLIDFLDQNRAENSTILEASVVRRCEATNSNFSRVTVGSHTAFCSELTKKTYMLADGRNGGVSREQAIAHAEVNTRPEFRADVLALIDRVYHPSLPKADDLGMQVLHECIQVEDVIFPVTPAAQPKIPSAFSPAQIGPSFVCPSPNDELGRIICDNAHLSRTDLIYVQAYQAARQQVGPDGAAALRSEALQFDAETRRKCGIVMGGMPTVAQPSDNAAQCIQREYEMQRDKILARLRDRAMEEASRAIEQHIDLQRALRTLGFLQASAPIDGVYGPATRSAIIAWQRATGLEPSGLLGTSDAADLKRAIEHPAGPVASIGNPSASPASATQETSGLQTYTEAWLLLSPRDKACISPAPLYDGAETPDAIARLLTRSGVQYYVHYNGKTEGSSNIATLRDRAGVGPVLALARGRSTCQIALRLMGD